MNTGLQDIWYNKKCETFFGKATGNFQFGRSLLLTLNRSLKKYIKNESKINKKDL